MFNGIEFQKQVYKSINNGFYKFKIKFLIRYKIKATYELLR